MHFHFVTSHKRRAQNYAIRSICGVTIRFSSKRKMNCSNLHFELWFCDVMRWIQLIRIAFIISKLNRSHGIEMAQRRPPNISCIHFFYSSFVVFMNLWWTRQIHCNHFMQQIDCIDHSTNLTIWFCIFQRKQNINLFIPPN